MVADLAAADDGSQSSPGSAEEGEEEEAEADDSSISQGHDNAMDNEQADPKPVYAEGNPLELLHRGVAHEAPNAADAESQKTAPAVTEVLEKI